MQNDGAFPRGARHHGGQDIARQHTAIAGIHDINQRRADQRLAGPAAGLDKLVVHMCDRAVLVQHAEHGMGLYRVAIKLLGPNFRLQHILAGMGLSRVFAQLENQEQQRKHDQQQRAQHQPLVG